MILALLLLVAIANAFSVEGEDQAFHQVARRFVNINLKRLLNIPENRQVRADASWSTCGGDGSIVIRLLHVPSVIKMPKSQIPISFDVQLNKEIPNVSADVSLQRKALFTWIPVPCIKDIGSCKYADLCSKVNIVEELAKHGLAICPFKSQRRIAGLKVDVPKPPTFLAYGRYRAQIKLNYFPSSLQKTYICLKIEFELSK